MEQSSTPRVSCPYLNSYIGRNVLIVGKVMQLRGDSAIIDSDGSITVHLSRESHLIAGNAAQVVGKITPDLSIKVLSAQDLGLDVDLELCRDVVEVAQQYKTLFAYDR